MAPLTDQEIRRALLKRLGGMSPSPRALLEEVRVHNGNAIADVVAIHRGAHCYEIKGETDTVQRIWRQGAYYDLAFQRITLVTTENHLKSATRVAPAHWGVMLTTRKSTDAEPRFRYLRKATDSPSFDKQLALLTLWREELVSLCSGYDAPVGRLSRRGLTQILADKSPARDITTWIGEKLATRQMMSGWSLTM